MDMFSAANATYLANVFSGDAYTATSLTAAIRQMAPEFTNFEGYFIPRGLMSPDFFVDLEDVSRSTLVAVDRESVAQAGKRDKRTAIPFSTYHFPWVEAVFANDLIGVRQWGQADITQNITEVVGQRLMKIKTVKYKPTMDAMRLGAIAGFVTVSVRDNTTGAVATETIDMFTKFNQTQQFVNLGLTTSGTVNTSFTDTLDANLTKAKIASHNQLSGLAPTRWEVLCGPTAYTKIKTALIKSGQAINVINAYTSKVESVVTTAPFPSFEYGEVTFKCILGGTDLLTTAMTSTLGSNSTQKNAAWLVPVGVPGMFIEPYAPGTIIEAVGTVGIPLYAHQELMKGGKGVELYVESNTLPINTRPSAVIALPLDTAGTATSATV